jgi:hypothetical protein
MQVVGSDLKMALSHRFEVPSERNNRLGSPAKQAAAVTQSIPLFDLSQAMSRLRESATSSVPNQKTNDYQTGRLASHANQLLAKIGLAGKTPDEAHLTDKQAATVRILEHVFGMPGIKTYGLGLEEKPNITTPSLLAKPFSLWDSLSSGQPRSYDYQESYRESRSTTITMNGNITTDDGRAFAFTIDYKMDPNFQRQANVHDRRGDSALPKVGTSIIDSVSDAAINQKNTINLSAHDDDGNGVLNDKDAIWNSLRSWTGGDRSPVLLSMWNIDAISITRIKAPVGNENNRHPQSEKGSLRDHYTPTAKKNNSAKSVDITI